jgi:hypothetical protein
MANEDELRLRIIADTAEFERQMAELGKMSDTVTAGGKGKGAGGGGKGPDPLKERLDSIRAEIDLTDLSLRKTLTASARKEQAIRQEAATGKLTSEQMVVSINAEAIARENATNDAIANFNRIETELSQLDQSQQAVINRQKQLFFASERAQNGFTTMSGAMTTLVSNTKMSSIAFANFGRIVQDAPFGLLGISNNIDPLLNSFAALRQEANGTGGALRAMGAQLLGPAGLIFLLGSALPTALLFLQKHKKDTGKEANVLADAIKNVRDEFARLSAQAAGEQGLPEINNELEKNKKAVDSINSSLATYQTNQSRIFALQTLFLQQGGRTREQQLELNKLISQNTSLNISQLQTDKAIIEANSQELTISKARIEAQNDLTNARKRYGIASALTSKQELEAAEKIKKEDEEKAKRIATLADQRNRLELSISALLDDELTNRIKQEKEATLELINNAQTTAEEKIRLQKYYDDISARLTKEHNDRLTQIALDSTRKAEEEKAKIVAQKTAQRNKDDEQRQTLKERRELAKSDAEISLLFARNQNVLGLVQQKEQEEALIRQHFAELGLSETEAEQKALAALEIDFARMVAMEKADQMSLYGDAVSAGLGAIFGEGKAVQSAQTVIDTLTGANKAFTGLMPNFPLAVAAAASVVAQGVSTLRKINSTDKNTKTISASKPSTPASSGGLPFVSDRSLLATPLASSVASNAMANGSFPINVEARIDQAGLAIAVRRGESDIASRQIPFAS